MSFENILKNALSKAEITADEELLKKLSVYAALLKDWNEKINLTAITDDEGIAVKHFADSLTVLKYVDFKNGASVIDVGTGAGFPGLVIAAARSDLNVTLLDSTGKKLKVVSNIAENMGLKNVTVLHARAEEASRNKMYRERFDCAVARAVAELRVLSEYCLPFVKCGGSFISMKGAAAEEEIKNAKASIALLGGEISEVHSFSLETHGERSIIEIKKISQTSPKYPRASAKIAAKPL